MPQFLFCRRIHTLIGHKAEISSAQFNWDCSLIATGSMDKTCKIWETNKGNQPFILPTDSLSGEVVKSVPHRPC